MKTLKLPFLAIAAFFILATVPNSAEAQTVLQVATWVQPASMSTNTTITVAENQLMEILSVSLDNSGSIDIVKDEATLTFGSGGNPIIPQPLVIAGPAVVTLKKTSTGGQSNLLTFRLMDSGVPTGVKATQLGSAK